MTELFEPFLRQIRHDLAGPLPGRAAQYRMAPELRGGADSYDTPRADARRGGVEAAAQIGGDVQRVQGAHGLFLRSFWHGCSVIRVRLTG